MGVQFRPAGRRAVVTPPSPTVGLTHVVGARVNYSGYPGLVAGTPQQDLATLEGRLRTVLSVTGNQFVGPHGYSGNTWPSTFAGTEVGWAPGAGYSYSFLNVKTGGSPSYSSWQNWANGGWNAFCTSYVGSVPDGHTHVFTINHEPSNDKGGGYTGPVDDGGAFEATYADQFARGFAQCANVVADLNRPNVFLAFVPMAADFPNNGQLGSLGDNQRDPEKWNPYKYMSAAARARTPLCADVYTNMLAGGSFQTLASKYQNVIDYAADAGWGVQKFGIFEHTYNDDANATDAQVAAAWNDAMAYLQGLGDRLACYLVFSSATGAASGTNGWVDHTNGGAQPYTAKLTAFGNGVRALNFGAGSGGGGIAFRAAATNTKNDSSPSVVIPSSAQVGDFCEILFGCTSTVTLTETALTAAGWTVRLSQDSNNERARIYSKFLVSGEPGSTLAGPVMSAGSRWAMAAVVRSGVNATTPYDVAPGAAGTVATDNLTQTTHSTGVATSTGTGRTVAQYVFNRGTSTANTALWQPPNGYTLRAASYPGALGTSLATADLGSQGTGTFGPSTWTSDVAVPSFVGVTAILKP